MFQGVQPIKWSDLGSACLRDEARRLAKVTGVEAGRICVRQEGTSEPFVSECEVLFCAEGRRASVSRGGMTSVWPAASAEEAALRALGIPLESA
jgi:hypothetical protein